MDFVNPYTIIDIPLLALLQQLAIGLVLAVVWAFVIRKSTRLIVDGWQYLPMFLILIPCMILIITIIKAGMGDQSDQSLICGVRKTVRGTRHKSNRGERLRRSPGKGDRA